ncbi:MAG TPA: gamma-glutamyltransferase, partial [Phycisphaerae bacterium]|nr:gamma-glutamyltransferase [Phycisphaerae bacterium]
MSAVVSSVRSRRRAVPLLAALLAPGLPPPALGEDPPWLTRGRKGMVASDSAEASQIGADVLKAGGNAFDAAIATSLALAVARPQSTGLGGGGFLLAYVAHDESFVALDFREVAPAAASTQRYDAARRRNPDGPSPSVYGGDPLAVPGQVAGLAEISRRFGTRPWGELVRPAAELARRGFTVDGALLEARDELLKDVARWPELGQRYAGLLDWLSPGGSAPRVGERLKNPDLARGLLLLAEMGPGAFYDGPLAEAVVRATAAAGGPLTADDLRQYRVRYREPIRFSYAGCEVVTMPPPSSGGVCLAEACNILAAARHEGVDGRHDAAHLLLEALKHAFADRARYLGDADFADVPVQRLTSRDHAEALARTIRRERTQAPERYGPAAPASGPAASQPDDRGTSHLCVVDRWGNVVALTETINGTFGSLVTAEPFGIVLNNQMDDFVTRPGAPNLFGLAHGEANVVAPGKRPLSSMSPTIVLRDGRPVLALGAAGGPRIITAVLQVMLATLDGAPLEQALAAPRLHHQWQPDLVFHDVPLPDDLRLDLERRGHRFSPERRTAAVNAIMLLPDGTLLGASDPRRFG